MSYEEPTDHVLHCYPFRATFEQVRRIRKRLNATPQWLHWHALDSLIRTQHACGDTKEEFDRQFAAADVAAVFLREDIARFA